MFQTLRIFRYPQNLHQTSYFTLWDCNPFIPPTICHDNPGACLWIPTAWLSKNVNTLRPRQTGRHFADDIFKCIFLNENVWIPIKISLKFIPKGPINNNPALVQIMVWRRPGAKPLSEPMMGSLLTHICVTRPQWVNSVWLGWNGCHFSDDIFKLIFSHDNCCIMMQSLLTLVTSHYFKH